jgi:hypothetical protein
MGSRMGQLGAKLHAGSIATAYAVVPSIRPLIRRRIMLDEWRIRFQTVAANPDVVDRLAAEAEQEARKKVEHGGTQWIYEMTDRVCRMAYESFCAGEWEEQADG